MIRRIVLSIVFAGVLLGNSVSAHHNMTALFDFNDRVTLTGTLSRVDWRNPHTYLTIDVKNASGTIENWQGEGPSPSWFRIRDIGRPTSRAAWGSPSRSNSAARATNRCQVSSEPSRCRRVASSPRVRRTVELITPLHRYRGEV